MAACLNNHGISVRTSAPGCDDKVDSGPFTLRVDRFSPNDAGTVTGAGEYSRLTNL
jgi:hypothetical protein